MLKKAVIHSFHSQVLDTLKKTDFEPDVLISFDSHLDLFLGNKEQIDAYPKKILQTALRACSHTMILRLYREIPLFCRFPEDYIENPEMIIIVPRICWETEVKKKSIKIKLRVV